MSKALETKKTIKFGEKEIEIKKLNLRKIGKLFGALESVPETFLKGQGDIKELPQVIMELLPKYADLAADLLDNQVTGEELLEADFDAIFDLIEAFLNVNDIPKIMERAGKVKALATGKAPLQEAIG